MAKVRIQARSADTDASESKGLPVGNDGNTKPKLVHVGALSLLLRVLRKEGFVGWYQVRISNLIFAIPR
jgi:hypothetical protein